MSDIPVRSMSLPPAASSRRALHRRTIQVESYERDDGLWDLEARLTDIKHYDFGRSDGSTHYSGRPVHDMSLRITINADFSIVAACAVYDDAPYDHHCKAIEPAYAGLVGLNLLKGFRQQVRTRFGRDAGCTHMSELTAVLPTVAIQTMTYRRPPQDDQGGTIKPFQLDGCHALSTQGEVVRQYYPRWYVGHETPTTVSFS